MSLAPHDDEVDALLATGAPWCSSTRSTRGCRAWSSTTSHGGELATRHLLELGHERIAFVGDTSDPGYGFVSSRLRCEGTAAR